MAVSLGMLATDVDKQWMSAPLSERIRVTEQLGRACKRLGVDGKRLSGKKGLAELPKANAIEVAEMLSLLARRLLDRLVKDVTWWRVVWRTLRRSERVEWVPRAQSLLNPFGEAARQKWLFRSARLLEQTLDENLADLHEVERFARDGRSWWQLSYNLACFYTRKGDPEAALRWLEIGLERPGSGEMGDEWLTKDPDLKSLSGQPRFDWIVAQLRQR
jgi:hypothetical protein